MAKTSRKRAVASVWSGNTNNKGGNKTGSGGSGDSIEWPVLLWDLVAVCLLGIVFTYCLWYATSGGGAGG